VTRLQLAPSILTADFGRLGEQIEAVDPYVDWWHLDVMDGHYVPNLTFGPSTVAAIRRSTATPIHVHLMITDPGSFAPAFVEAGATRISFHPEVTEDPEEVAGVIRETGAGVGFAVHPDVPLDAAAAHLASLDVVLMMTVRPGFGGQAFLDEVIPKIRKAKSMVESARSDADIEVDGGVNLSTVDRAVEAGGEILVAGSAVYDGKDPAAAARRMRDRLEQLEREGT
jgi:ribulose-phosphate 3-epimerase